MMSNMAMLGCIHEAMQRQGYSQKDINEMIMTMYELLDEMGEPILEEEPELGFFFVAFMSLMSVILMLFIINVFTNDR